MTINYSNKNSAKVWYEKRYQTGYMQWWSSYQKKKVAEVFRKLNLPPKGKALDFGCGNGIFTAIFKKKYPDWEVFGYDISQSAIENASRLYPECSFFNNLHNHLGEFDFLFSHHVLEHVIDLEIALQEINSVLKTKANVLQILPSGNKYSFEYYLVTLVKGGIETENNDRFFFEETGHLRRLTSKQLSLSFNKFGFELKNAFYDYHFWSALDWITNASPLLVWQMTPWLRGINGLAKIKLFWLRFFLLSINLIRLPVNLWERVVGLRKKTGIHYLFLVIDFPILVLILPLDFLIRSLSFYEWKAKQTEKSGSEMFLFFVRK